MTKQVQRRRGTASQHTSFTGAEGEISVNTTNKSVHVHDGVTAGGVEAARADLANVSDASLNTALAGNTLSSLTITSADINGGTIDGTVIGGTTPAAVTATSLTATGTTTLAGASTTADITFGDNDKAIFGAGSDLQIYHDGFNSYISEQGTGSLNILASTEVAFLDVTGTEYVARFNDNADVKLYYDNSLKLATTSTGVDVTGTVTADGLTVENTAAGTTASPQYTNVKFVGYLSQDRALIRAVDTASSVNGGQLEFLTTDATNSGHTRRININRDGDISFYEDTGTTPKFFWDASTERLGIGNAAPATTLDVTGTVTANGLILDPASTPVITMQDATGANGYIIRSAVTSTSDFGLRFRDIANKELMQINQNGDISFYEDTGTTPKFFWDASAESLGIGTSSPAQKLHVAGNILMNNNGELRFIDSGGTQRTAVSLAGNDLNVGTSAGGSLKFYNGSSYTERMRITSTGNVGIGTSSPQDELHVRGGTGSFSLERSGTLYDGTFRFVVGGLTGGGLRIIDDTLGTNLERMRIEPSGDVDIGSTGGGAKLAIAGSVGTQNGTAAAPTHTFYGDNNTGMFRAAVDTLGFSTAGSEGMRIDASGNLLVGKPAINATDVGIVASANGRLYATVNGDTSLFNRLTSDGDIVEFRKDNFPVGSIGAVLSDLSIGTTNTKIRFFDAEDRLIPVTSSGSNSDGNTSLGRSTNRFKDLYLSGGVYLGGTGAANLLDDYEEGTHEVTVTPSISGTVTLGSAYDDAAYTKVGRLVNVTGGLDVTGISSPSGYLIVSLPFQVATGSQASRASAAITVYNTTGANTSDFTTLLVNGESAMRIYLGDATSLQNDSAEAMTSISRIVFSVTYVTN